VLGPLVTYLFKIDREKWEEFAARVKSEGRTIKWVIEELIREYTEHGLRRGRKDKKS
jgi:hypothetical protein